MPPNDASDSAPPPFDKQAARQRYRATMRGPYMRMMFVLLALIILTAWGLGIGAVFAGDVERLALGTSRRRVRSEVPGSGEQRQPGVVASSQQLVLADGGLHALDRVEVAVLPDESAPECGDEFPLVAARAQVARDELPHLVHLLLSIE